MTGVVHKDCGGVMRKHGDVCYTSEPPQWRWSCPKCGYSLVTSHERLKRDPSLQVFA